MTGVRSQLFLRFNVYFVPANSAAVLQDAGPDVETRPGQHFRLLVYSTYREMVESVHISFVESDFTGAA